MADQKIVAKSGGVGFCGLLTIVLIALKLTGFIELSWVWVLAPLWAPFALVVLVVSIFVLTAIVGVWRDRRNG